MSEREAFRRAICENPDDDTPRLVFADWLDENGGEAQAEFIRLQIKLAGVPEAKLKAKDVAREKELLEAHREEWTEPLKEFEGYRTGDYYVFRRGFVEAIGSDGEIMVEEGDRLFTLAPVRAVRLAEEEEYGGLAKCKWLLRLHTLDLKGSGLSRHFGPAPLIKSRYLANLTTLGLGGEDDNGHLDMAGVRALVASKHLAKLEALDLSGNWLDQFDPDTFPHFLTAKNLPSLRNLDLARVGIKDIGAVALAGTPWVAQLKVVNLSRNSIGDGGCRAILESPLLENVERLDLRDNLGRDDSSEGEVAITPQTRRDLAKRFGKRVLL